MLYLVLQPEAWELIKMTKAEVEENTSVVAENLMPDTNGDYNFSGEFWSTLWNCATEEERQVCSITLVVAISRSKTRSVTN
jgi:hypothetical protein